MLNSNKRTKFAHFQKGASQLMLNNALATEMINLEKEKLGSFDKVKNVVIKRQRTLLNIYVIQKCKRTPKLLMFRLDLRKMGVCSKSVTKTLYQNNIW